MVTREEFDDLYARTFAAEMAITLIVDRLSPSQQTGVVRGLEEMVAGEDAANVVELDPNLGAHTRRLRDAAITLATQIRESIAAADAD